MSGDKHDDAWEEEVESVTPLKGDGKKRDAQPTRRSRPRHLRPTNTSPIPNGPRHQVPFDPKLYNNIATGKVRLEAKLDLHGMTESHAHQMLVDMIEAAWNDGKRRLLVITGRGQGGTSPLRAVLPKWLSAPALTPYVISFDYAAQRHGDDGALYVLLRRQS